MIMKVCVCDIDSSQFNVLSRQYELITSFITLACLSGITGQGYEAYRQDLTCLYLPKINLDGTLKSIDIIPCSIKNLKVQRATNQEDIAWIREALSREGKALGTSCKEVKDSHGNTNLYITWESR